MATWSSIGNLEAITFRDLYDLIQAGGALENNPLTTSQITGTEQKKAITKTELLYYTYVNTANQYLSPKATNQIVVKRDVTPIFVELDVKYQMFSKKTWDSYPDKSVNANTQRRTLITSYPTSPTLYGFDFNQEVLPSGADGVIGFKITNSGQVDTTGTTTITVGLPRKWNQTSDTAKAYWDEGDTSIPISATSVSYSSLNRYITFNIGDATNNIPAGDSVYVYLFIDFSLFGTSFNTQCNYTTDVLDIDVTSPDAQTFSNNYTSLQVGNFAPLRFGNISNLKGITNNSGYVSGTDKIPYNTNFTWKIESILYEAGSDVWDITDPELTITLPSTLTYVSLSGAPANIVYNPDGTTTITFSGYSYTYLSGTQPTADWYKEFYLTVKFNTENTSATVNAVLSSSQHCPSVTDSLTEISDYNRTPTYTSQGYITCYSCNDAQVYRDTNVNSSTYDDYYVLVGSTYYNVGSTAPASGGCNFNPNYGNLIGSRCVNCVNYNVYQNTNPCFTDNQYYTSENGGTTYATDPRNGGCVYSATWGTYLGQICINCITYDVYQNTNPCYTGNQYYSTNGQTWATNPTTTACNNDPIYGSYLGSYCVGCTEYNVFQNTNGCYTGVYQYYEATNTNPYGGTQLTSNPLTTGTPCNFSANWVDASFNTCQGCTTYDVYLDDNFCSPTYGHYQVNGSYWGSTAPASGDCVTTPTYDYQGYYTCYNCTTYPVLRQTNPCAANYLDYFVSTGSGYTNLGSTAPSSDPCACCTTYYLSNNTGSYETVYYTNCDGTSTSITLNPYQGYVSICRQDGTSWTIPTGVTTISGGTC